MKNTTTHDCDVGITVDVVATTSSGAEVSLHGRRDLVIGANETRAVDVPTSTPYPIACQGVPTVHFVVEEDSQESGKYNGASDAALGCWQSTAIEP